VPKLIEGFKNFILRGNAIDLAVGVVIGASFNGVVNALVKDMFTPIIGIFLKNNFSNLFFTVNGSKFMYGDLLNNILSFLIVAAAIYFFVMVPMNAFLSRVKKPKAPTTKKCPECLSEIPVGAKRCSYCTQILN
jgi:large conductance mechanosensitive channel